MRLWDSLSDWGFFAIPVESPRTEWLMDYDGRSYDAFRGFTLFFCIVASFMFPFDIYAYWERSEAIRQQRTIPSRSNWITAAVMLAEDIPQIVLACVYIDVVGADPTGSTDVDPISVLSIIMSALGMCCNIALILRPQWFYAILHPTTGRPLPELPRSRAEIAFNQTVVRMATAVSSAYGNLSAIKGTSSSKHTGDSAELSAATSVQPFVVLNDAYTRTGSDAVVPPLLKRADFFHGEIGRSAAEDRLKAAGALGDDGMFLVRDKGAGKYALSRCRDGRFFHHILAQEDAASPFKLDKTLVCDHETSPCNTLEDVVSNLLKGSTAMKTQIRTPVPPPHSDQPMSADQTQQAYAPVVLGREKGTERRQAGTEDRQSADPTQQAYAPVVLGREKVTERRQAGTEDRQSADPTQQAYAPIVLGRQTGTEHRQHSAKGDRLPNGKNRGSVYEGFGTGGIGSSFDGMGYDSPAVNSETHTYDEVSGCQQCGFAARV